MAGDISGYRDREFGSFAEARGFSGFPQQPFIANREQQKPLSRSHAYTPRFFL